MSTTERLYYRHAELLTFDANVVDHHLGDHRLAVLDRTAFYPTSGGQPHDIGTINGVPVTEVVDEGEVIVHHLAQPVPVGAVNCIIDGVRRHDHMQQHTAQHLISALAADRLQWPTTSVHFGDEGSSIEFGVAFASPDQMRQLEEWSNRAVRESHAVTVTFEDAATAAGLRTPAKRDGELRIITIEALDRSACGGTHVSRTSEIGPVRLTGVEKVRGHIRVGFLAGERVMQQMRSQEELIAVMAGEMGCAPDELRDLLPKRLAELQEARARLESVEGEVALARVKGLVETAVAGSDGVHRIVYHGSAGELRKMAQSVGGMSKVLFFGGETLTGVLVIAASIDSGIDAGALLKNVVSTFGGKGGGSPRIAQGSVPAKDLESALKSVMQRPA